MKIAILTLPLHSNIGGILQLWALQQTLRALGHKPIALRICFKRHPKILWPLAFCHRLYLHLITRLQSRRAGIPLFPGLSEAVAERHIRPWIRTHIAQTPPVVTEEDVCAWLQRHPEHALLIGSDQIWNPAWTRPLYFGDGLDSNPSRRRIVYAASFGCTNPDFGHNLIRYREHLQHFDAVSVRETEGIPICEQLFGIHVTQRPDPTLLLSPEEWLRSLRSKPRPAQPGTFRVARYFLSDIAACNPAISATLKGLHTVGLHPVETVLHTPRTPASGLFPALPGIETWLTAIRDADAVLTDSFHATVFSLLFGKPFLTFVKPEETSAGRIESLLTPFHLQHRLIQPGTQPDFHLLLEPLPENRSSILKAFRIQGREFLSSAFPAPAT